MKVGDLVRMSAVSVWRGQTGIVTKVPASIFDGWSVLLTSGELITTYYEIRMEVISASR